MLARARALPRGHLAGIGVAAALIATIVVGARG